MVDTNKTILDVLAEQSKGDMEAVVYYNIALKDLILCDLVFLPMGVLQIFLRAFYIHTPITKFDLKSLAVFAQCVQSNLFIYLFFDRMRKCWLVQKIETQTGRAIQADTFANIESITGSFTDLKEHNKAIL